MLMRYGLLLLVEISFAAAFRPTLLAARGNASSVAPWLCDVQVVCRSMLVCIKSKSHATPFQSDTVIQTPKRFEPTLRNLRLVLVLGTFTLACVCVIWRSSAAVSVPSEPAAGPHLDLDASLTVCGVGRYQLTIVLAILLAWMADGAENVLLHSMAKHLVHALDTDEISVADLRIFSHAAMACSAFLSGSAADSFGRRPVFCISCLLATTFSLLSIFAPAFWFFCCCRVLAGIGLGALVGTDVALLCEFLPSSRREWVVPFLYVGYVVGRLFADFCAFKLYPMFDNWRLPFLLCSLPLVPSCMLRFSLHETPQALLARGFVGHAKRVLGDVAETNRGIRSTSCLITGARPVKQYQGLDFRNCLNAGVWATIRQNQLERVLAVAALAFFMALGRLLNSLLPELEAHFSLFSDSFRSTVWFAALICLWCALSVALMQTGLLAWDIFVGGCLVSQGVLLAFSYLFQMETPGWKSFNLLLSAWAMAEGLTSTPFYAICVRMFPEHARATSLGFVDAISRSVVALQPFLAADLLSSIGTALSAAVLGGCWLCAAALALVWRHLWQAPSPEEVEASKA
ncbi:svop-1 [Symbiodinium natans]|uniref:Svop-1 protein n=1 Tax=Symbiodinium natans TaxID=878477 RepID=A0A812UJW0_9DINO|nr:svop-1 [Symbiodinium natans]